MIGYARVSTADQTCDPQIDSLRAVPCDEVFADTGYSGSTVNRPELDRALATLLPGDVLVVARLDRLGRSLSHLVALIQELADRGVGVRAIAEGVDTSSGAGRLVMHVFGALAEFERTLIAERTRASLAAKRRRGETLGRRRRMTPSQVKAAAKMLDDGESASYVARLFRVDPSTVRRSVARQRQVAA